MLSVKSTRSISTNGRDDILDLTFNFDHARTKSMRALKATWQVGKRSKAVTLWGSRSKHTQWTSIMPIKNELQHNKSDISPLKIQPYGNR
jgi:hypothetical protein